MNTPRTELATALRAVNRAWAECPEPRPNVFANLAELEREVDAAVAIDESGRARAAVEAWREDALTVIAIRTAHAPLTSPHRGDDGPPAPGSPGFAASAAGGTTSTPRKDGQ